jgi:Putative zinc-finger
MPPMCGAVRDLLPEFALGVLPLDQRAEVEAHVAWCAGCRKESSELGQGAATVAFALPPATPPRHVEDAVVGSIRSAASSPAGRPRTRAAVAATVAAMVAVSALGWGVGMAGRAERYENRAAREAEAKFAAIQAFEDFVTGGQGAVIAPLPDDEMHLGRLAPVGADMAGGGFVLQLVSPDWIDFAFTHVSGLPTDRRRAPYRIYLLNEAGDEVRAGRIDEVDRADGTGEVYKQFPTTELTGFTKVVVRDAAGEAVMRGTIDADA